jgi:hypothetical protein
MPKRIVTLRPRGVIAPIIRAIQDSMETVAIALKAMETADLSMPVTMEGTFWNVFVEIKDRPPQQRRAEYTTWLLTKGFQELTNGVRKCLEEALVYLEVTKIVGTAVSYGEFEKLVTDTRLAANKSNFPNLLDDVSNALKTPLVFKDEFASLNAVRNCLEHRGGIVGTQDLKNDTVLRLTMPQFQLFLDQEGTEVPVSGLTYVEKDSILKGRRGKREWTFAVGDRVKFTPEDFQLIAMGCLIFANHDIGPKLPTEETQKPQSQA